jgi:hypothetical protein
MFCYPYTSCLHENGSNRPRRSATEQYDSYVELAVSTYHNANARKLELEEAITFA